jgi:hypothetical protein
LAASLEVRSLVPSLVLISADADLNMAAMAEGLPVENPQPSSLKQASRGQTNSGFPGSDRLIIK